MFLVLSTMSCSIMGYGKPRYTLGMNEQEFVHQNKVAQKVTADDRGLTIYRTNNGLQSLYAFFVFDRGKLVRYEEAANSDDYKFIRL